MAGGHHVRNRPSTRTRSCAQHRTFHVIARLDAGDCAADIYSREAFDVSNSDRQWADWPRSLPVPPDAAADRQGLDHTLTAAGFRRTSSWRKRITTSGAVRYFADATSLPCACGQIDSPRGQGTSVS